MADETSPLLPKSGSTWKHDSINLPSESQGQYDNVNGSGGVEGGEVEPVTPAINPLWIVAPMSIGIFLSAMDGTFIVASYASIGNELKQLQKTSWVATSYMLTVTACQPFYGKLSDIFGRKSCLLCAYCIFGIGCFFCGISQTMDQLILSRALAGIGGGGMPTVTTIIMSDVVPLRSRGAWQGVLNIIYSSGLMIGAPLGGYLADTIGWRWAFLIQLPPLLLAFIVVTFTLQLPSVSSATPNGYDDLSLSSKIKRVDFAGAISLIFFIFFFLYSLDRGGNVSWSDKWTLTSLALSVFFFAAFGLIERHVAKEPFAPSQIILNRSLLSSYLENLFGIAAQLGVVFQSTLYVQAVHLYSAAGAGTVLMPGTIGGVTGSIVGGLVIKATGRYWGVTVAGCSLQVVGLVVVLLGIVLGKGVVLGVGVAAAVVGLCVGLLLSGFGNGSAITTSLIALISNAGKEDQAIATGVAFLFRSLGSVVGLSIGGTVLQETLRTVLRRRLTREDGDVDEIILHVRQSLMYLSQLTPRVREIVLGAYEDGMKNTVYVCLGFAVGSVVCSLFVREKRLEQ
ncbi:MFS general substrate transporter [Marasmius fiardii PR-910]|nr:MFS general substrate transporter [Marasmius fiardii PR-910]